MKLLADFHQAILTNDSTKIVSALKAHPRLSPEKQFAIYADGYRIRLLAAVRSDFPALIAYLSDTKFNALALDYIEKNSPRSYNLDFYPHKFAEFISNNSDDIFAKELAILEGIIAEVFMLPDSEPLSPEALSNLSPEKFGDKKLQLRTASRLLEFSTNVNEWLNEQRVGNSKEVELSANFLLVYRHNNEVQRYKLSQAEFLLLQQLSLGNTIMETLEKVTIEHEELAEIIAENLQKYFQKWVSKDFFAAT
ncbi:MAG: DNA-binding domain-containing protein [Rickettsiales bacterium]